ncbi:hypothetical protein C923_01799 [Plasmodium falciparum UGT5.1]|uniref:Duffy-binding-like domain-containing protein n=3 Tax=Plasmodium falciparum TaxID=5833 RepID=W7JF65_PLAFA|nr:hypothetical protein C923_01799 [Plasmodium falciparum UGT5.1]
MVRPPRAPDYTNVKDAKELLDLIGQTVHAKVHSEALDHSKSELHGFLSKVVFSGGEKTKVFKECDIDKEFETNVSDGHNDPCEGRRGDRFSDTKGAECDRKKIEGSTNDTVGACAPLRRLSLCDTNLEHIDAEKIKNTHSLYVDVLLAAKHEGQMIANKLQEYDATNYESRICTELARSFADIGDIIRGKDLYRGDKEKKEKLELKLKSFFKNIYDDLINDQGKKDAAIKHYFDPKGNYYQLREDWWDLNRHDVWKAITCSAPNEAKYNVIASDGTTTKSNYKKCRNIADVTTYFDYVPQYLRWFEEWAEDFCRKKKKYVDIVKTYCRGQDKYGKERYCSRNGYDCEKTKRAVGKYRMGKQCISCLYACNPYVEWIDNQRKQFLKQKNKYADEMKKYESGAVGNGTGRSRKTRAATTTKYEGYEKIFYEKLKSEYRTVDKFLNLLNKEKACQAVKDSEGGIINFKNVKSSSASDSGTNDKTKGTFYRSKYCQPCPHCGVKHKGGSGWEEKSDNEQCRIKLYKPINGQHGTPIKILKSGDEEKEIETKLNAFCNQTNGDTTNGTGGNASGSGGTGTTGSDSQKLYQNWQCYEFKDLQKDGEGEDDDDDHYYENDVRTGGGLCILKKEEQSEKKIESDANSQKEPAEIQKTFHDFFYYWVAHMLKDSIYWRTKKLERCLQNGNRIKCGNKKCNNDCDCFLKWVKKKETEWEKIKVHFNTQEGLDKKGESGEQKMLSGVMTPDFVLQYNLQIEFLNEDSTQDTQNSLNAEELKHLKHLSEMLQKENAQGTAGGSGIGGSTDGKKKTLMDKLIEYEKGEAKKCVENNPEKCPEDTAVDLGRTLPGHTAGPVEDEDDDDDNEGEDDDDDEEEEKEEDTGSQEDTGQTPAIQDNTEKSVDVCKTVEEALKLDKSLKEACSLKYGSKSHVGWKCVPTTSGATTERVRGKRSAPETTTSSDNKGGLCIPPRRRRLYVTPLTKWATNTVETQARGSEASSQSDKLPQGLSTPATSSQSPSDPLLTAFVESAAVETFFLWHKFKMDKEREDIERKEREKGLVVDKSSKPDELDGHLKEGNIPEEFKRQMFYTLGDYRDILFSGSKDDKNGGNNIVVNASGNKEDMEKIQHKIKEHINSVSKPSGQTPQQWWERNAKDIWDGMICALTYKESDTVAKGKSTALQQIDGASKLLEKLKENNDYETVSFGASGTGGPKGNDDIIQPPTLKNFVEIPTFFRYLEEWGQNFCKERKKRLEKINEDCKQGDDKCSGYGENCETILSKNSYDTVADLDCPRCGRHCSSYTKWIERKKDEFTEQQNAYGEQQKKCQTQSNADQSNKAGNGVCGKLETTCTTSGDFLNRLKKGPCKVESGEDKKEDDYIKFKEEETFQPAKDCKPCSKFSVNCENVDGNCTKDRGTSCQTKNSIGPDDIENEGNSTNEVVMRVSDNNTNGNEFDDSLEACNGAGIFTGIIEKKWECRKVCGYVVCKPKNGNGKTTSGENNDQIITITALVTHWVQNFLEDYNKIKHKISHCTNTVEGSKCINGCQNKCKCVGQWIDNKKKEWEKIKERFNEQYNGDDTGMKSSVKNFFEELIPKIAATIDKGNHNGLVKLVKSVKCNCGNNSQNGKEGEENDLVKCLLDKLGERATSCQSQHSDKPEALCQDPPPEPDEDLSLEETEENPVAQPKICPEPEKPPEEKEESGCEPAENSEEPAPPSEETNNEDIPDTGPPVPEPPPPAPEELPSQPIPQPSDNTSDILATTIPFGVASKITDNEWNTLKHDFISNMLQNQPNDVSNDYTSGDIPMNTQPNTLYFDNNQEKPFITSIHDRNLYSGEENNYNINMSTNSMDDPKYVSNNVYSGIDLINDSLSGNEHIDIYDELLKRKENELFGTNHPKHISSHNVTKSSNSDPIINQLDLFHTWLDRHRDMCEKWENHHERLAKLKEEWENETHSGNTHTSDSNKTLNTDVYIQIHMDDPKPINEFTNMNTILEDLDKYNEPYYDVQDDIYYDVHDHDTSTVDSNAMDVPSKVQIEMDINTKLVKEKYPIADVWDI